MKKYIIEVEEKRAEAVINLLAQISVKIGKPTEEKKRYVKVESNYSDSDSFLCLTEEQFRLLNWLSENYYYSDWEEVDPSEMFEEV